jgi:hypothetical protein
LSRDQSLENLIEMLITMTGRSNKRIGQLEKRIEQLEFILRSTNLPDHPHNQPKIRRVH